MPGASCPYCGASNEGYTAMEEGTEPSDGALTVCAYCCKLGVFEHGLIRKPNQEEWEELKEHPQVVQAVQIAIVAKRLRGAL